MIKRLLQCVREFKLATLLAPLTMVGEVAMEVLIPTLMARLIDKGIKVGDMGYVTRQGLLLVLCAFLSLAFGSLSAAAASYAATGFARHLRHDMYYNVQTLDFSNIHKFSPSSIATQLPNDVAHFQIAFHITFPLAARRPMLIHLAS